MSAATTQPPAYGPGPHGAGATAARPLPGAEACPLCGAPLQPDQEWCLRCGAAARTRLAAVPNWKAPVAIFATVVAISLGVLAAALVKLAGGSGTPPTITRTVTGPAAAVAPATPGSTPLATPATPGAASPGAASTPTTGTATHAAGGATAAKPPAAASPGATRSGSSTPARGSTPTTPTVSGNARSPLPSLAGVGGVLGARLKAQRNKAK
jgi:hypothetical protein